MKRILTGGLVALLLASMLPATALAAGPALTFGSEPPASVASNANFSVTVHAVDAGDLAVPGDVVSLGLKGGTGTGGASFGCDSPTATTNGSGDATFTGCSVDLVGTGYVLTASDATPLSVDSSPFAVTPGTATKLVVTSQPSASATASVAFAAQPEITIEDAAGNVETGDSSTQVAIALTSAGGATLAGTKTVTASAGVVSFTNLSINKVATYTLTATSSGLASAVTGSIVVGPASADHLVVTATTPQTAGTSFSVTVTAKDPDGNTDTGYAGAVHFTSTDGGAGVVLPTDYTFVVGDHGVHTFSNGVKLVTAATQTVTATDTIASSVAGTSGGIVVKASTAVSLVVSGFPDPVTAGTASTVTVTAKDTYGNTATGYTGNVTITSSDPAAVLPGAHTFTGGDAGIHVFAVTLLTTGLQSISAGDGSLSGSQTSINVNPATATHLTVVATTPQIAGTAFSVTVTALDGTNNTDTNYTGTIHFTTTDAGAGVALPADYTFVTGDHGVHTFSAALTLATVGSQTVTATDTTTASIHGTTASIAVNPGVATHFVLTGVPSTVTAGAQQSLTVTAKDAEGNTATGYTGTVTITSTDGAATKDAPHAYVLGDAGVHLFHVTFKTSGTQSVTAADGSLTATQSNITVNPAAAFSLHVVAGTSQTAGSAFSVTVTAQDSFGNTVTGYAGSIHFTSNDAGATLPVDYTFVSGTDHGVHVFSNAATLTTAGTHSITATDKTTGSINGSQAGITVHAAAATHFVVAGFASPVVAGTAGTVTVTAKDGFGNTDTSYTGSVSLSSGDAQASFDPAHVYVLGDAGVHVFGGTLKTSGSQSITATDGSISGSQSSITVNPAGAATLAISPVAPQVAGAAFDVTVTALDAFGNIATGYAGTVHFTKSDSGVGSSVPANYTFVPGTDHGDRTFTSGAKLVTSGSQSVTATDTITASITGSRSVTVNAGPAVAMVVSGFTSPATAGVADTFTVTAQDSHGNAATGYTGTIHFTSTDPLATLPADYTFVPGDGGVHVFSATLKTAGTQSITAGDGSLSDSQPGITVNPAGASVLVVTAVSPQIRTIAFDVTVTARDPFGNLATGYSGTVGLSSSDGGATLPAAHTFTGADSGVFTFTVTLDTPGSQTVTATDQTFGSITGTSSAVTVSATGNGVQNLTFAVADSVFGAADFTVTATSDAGLTAFTYSSKTTPVCTVSGATVHIVAAGLCTITADQAGDPTYAPASIDASFTVAKAVNTITFNVPPPTENIGDTFTVSADAASGGVVTFSIDPAATTFCSLTGGTLVHFDARGACLVDGTAPATANYLAGTGQLAIPVSDIAPTCSDPAPATAIMNVAKSGTVTSCTDAELDYPLSYSVDTQGAHGTAAFVGAQWTYTPDPNQPDGTTDSFTFRAEDSLSAFSLPATVSITIVNRPVKAKTDAATVPSVRPTSINVLANDLAGYLASAPTVNQDPGQPLTITAVTQGSLGTVTTDGHTVRYDPNGCAYGSDLFSYTASDGLTTSTAYVAVTVARPGQAGQSKTPVTNAPTVSFVSGTKMGTTVPVHVAWCGLTSTSKRLYKVIQSSNGGASYPTTVYASTTLSSTNRLLTVGANYAWRVRTYDGAGRASAYTGSLASKVWRFQNNNPLIIYSAGWGLVKSSSVSGGTEAYTFSAGATATLALPAGTRAFAIVSSRASTRGSFQVWVDGVLASVVSQKASGTAYQVILAPRSVTSTVVHTIQIRAVGNGRIDLDAILTLQ